MQILKYPENEKELRLPTLQVTKEIKSDTTFLSKLDQLKELALKDGIGIAASQVNWQVKLFVLTVDRNLNKIEPTVYINPIITRESRSSNKAVEGCLSFEGLDLAINRPSEIDWSWEDLSGQTHQSTEKFSLTPAGYYIRVIQHETEHLSQKLFIDNASSVQILKIKKWLKERINGRS